MTLTPLLLVVLAAFIHAAWNLLAKKAAFAGPAFVWAYSLFATLFYAPWVLVIFASGGMAWSLESVGFILASTLLHLSYSLCLQTGYAKADLSVVYPVARGTGPMLATLGAVMLLGEMVTTQTVFGLVLVVSGIWLIATQGRWQALTQPGAREGVGWGLATGGLIASYTVVDAHVVKTIGTPPVVLDWFNNLLRVVILWPVIARDLERSRRLMAGHWWRAVMVGALSPLSYILVLTALEMGAPVSLVAPLRETSMMVGALMGIVLLKERAGPWRLAGCAILVAGGALLAAA